MPWTLSLYIGRRFLSHILLALAGMLLVMALGDLVELIRRTADVKIHFGLVMEMLLLKLPDSGVKILPFAVLIGGMSALTQLTRTHELIVVRVAGVSVWQFLLPALIVVLLMGAGYITIGNPVAAAMFSRFEQLEGQYITGHTSMLSLSSTGLWIKQMEHDATGGVLQHFFHATKVEQDGLKLTDVIVLTLDKDNKFVSRMDARYALLEHGQWHLHEAVVNRSGERPVRLDDILLKTDLTAAQIQDSFASPVTLSFWQLPGFIRTLEKAGFSAIHHRMYWHITLALPLLLCAMILIAAVFSLRLPRRGGVALLVVSGIVTGFLTYFLADLVYAFGQSGDIPVVLAAWAPALIALMVGGGLLLHLEDG